MISTSMMLRRTILATAAVLALSSPPAFAGKVHLAGLQSANASDRSFDQFIVKYRDGSQERKDPAAVNRGLSRAAQALAPSTSKIQSGKGGSRVGGIGVRHLRRMSLGADVIRVDRKLDRLDAETLMRQIAADPNVVSVEVDGWKRPVLTPNDPTYAQQWHYQATSAGISLPAAWDVATGAGIVVAVIDTGSTPHSDLNANTIAGYDFITNSTTAQDGGGRDNNANDPGDWFNNYACGGNRPEDEKGNSSWHGTHVAGTVAAVTNNGKGVAGVAFGAKVQHARVLGRCGGRDSDIVDAIVWSSGGTVSGVPANPTPAKVLNLSLGGRGACSDSYVNAVNSARSRGAVVVVAAGNDGNPVSENTPANCPGVITVGSSDRNGGRSIWVRGEVESSHGAGVDIAAPGSSIWSTMNSGATSQSAENYVTYSGTSMATPHVAGVVALAQSTRRALGLALWTPDEVEAKLKATVKPFPVSIDKPIGAGILNAAAAVAAAGGGTTPPPPTGNVLSNGVPINGLSAASNATLTYTFNVPAGSTNLRITTAGGTGDADLEVLRGTSAACPKSEGTTNAESCTVANPVAGTYTIKVFGYRAFSGLTLSGTYTVL